MVWRWGKDGDYIIIYLSVHCHHHNDSCIKMGSDVSLIIRGKVTRQCPQITTLLKRGEPERKDGLLLRTASSTLTGSSDGL